MTNIELNKRLTVTLHNYSHVVEFCNRRDILKMIFPRRTAATYALGLHLNRMH